MLPPGIVQAVRIIIGLLVDGNYTAVENITQGNRLSASNISSVINNYGRRLIDPPDDAFGKIQAIDIDSGEQTTFAVDFPLWTEEEGRSDLEVRLTLTEVMDGIYSTTLDDILVP